VITSTVVGLELGGQVASAGLEPHPIASARPSVDEAVCLGN